MADRNEEIIQKIKNEVEKAKAHLLKEKPVSNNNSSTVTTGTELHRKENLSFISHAETNYPRNDDLTQNIINLHSQMNEINNKISQIISNNKKDISFNSNRLEASGSKPIDFKSKYDINELLAYDDEDFITTAYRAILQREPDEAGFAAYLSDLRSMKLNKIEILYNLRYSSIEGQNKNITITNLNKKYRYHKIAQRL